MHPNRRKVGSTDLKITTSTDMSRPRRPQVLTRKSTTTPPKLGKSPKVRAAEWEEERWWEDERESFPQFCMTCEKQFIPHAEKTIYCSEVCRKHDQGFSPAASACPPFRTEHGRLPMYSAVTLEPRDIIPRAAPSRPSDFSPPASPTGAGAPHHTSRYSRAVSALRSLSARPPSPASPARPGAESLWPTARTAGSTKPEKPPTALPSTYDSGYASGYGHGHGYGYGNPYGYHPVRAVPAERPLPARRPGECGRPRSIELVTPIIGR